MVVVVEVAAAVVVFIMSLTQKSVSGIGFSWDSCAIV